MTELAWIVSCAWVAACGGSAAPTVDGPGVAAGDLYLTVENVGARCTVTIGDGQPSASAEQTLADYFDGQTIPVSASAPAGLTVGPWHHTSSDLGAGDPGTLTADGRAANVTLGDSPGCAWICCSATPGDCPTSEQCP